jgi:hypothetical protein
LIKGINGDLLRRVYDFSEMTEEELKCKFFQKLEECITLCNNTNDIINWIKDVAIEEEVNELLTLWLEDGTLNEIIDTNLIDIVKSELMEEINEIKIEIENIKKEIEALKNKGV